MAAKVNLIVDQGSDWEHYVDIVDGDDVAVDLTGYTGLSSFRKHYTSTNATSISVTVYAANSTVKLALTSNTSNAAVPGRYLYDVELYSNGQVGAYTTSRIQEGIITITPGMTRA